MLPNFENSTFVAWIKTSTYHNPNPGAIVSKPRAAGSSASGLSLRVHSSPANLAQLALHNGSVYTTGQTGVSPTDGNWHLLVGTANGTQTKIYIDGVLSDSDSLTANGITSTQPLAIGCDNGVSGGSYFFQGVIDDVRIYNRALSETEIQELAGPAAASSLLLWFDANDVNGDGQADALADNSAVASWVDKATAGNGVNTVTQANTARQPVVRTNQQNGLPVVRFDGGSDGTGDIIAGTCAVNGLEQITIIAVTKDINTADDGVLDPYGSIIHWTEFAGQYGQVVLESYNRAGGAEHRLRGRIGSGAGNPSGWWRGNDITPPVHTFGISMVTRNKRAVATYFNGIQRIAGTGYGTGDAIVGTTADFGLGHAGGTTLNPPDYNSAFNGEIAEVLVYNKELNTAERKQLTDYLAAKWGISTTDPIPTLKTTVLKQWTTGTGANNHWYEGILAHTSNGEGGGWTWDEANKIAKARGGYLTTITSAEENSWIKAQMIPDMATISGWHWGPLIGGRKVGGVWEWANGETWSYTGWQGGQPDNHEGLEDKLAYWSYPDVYPGQDNWNDTSSSHRIEFIIEYDSLPE
jgi:hypothetical protein